MVARYFENARHARKPARLGAVFALMVIVALFAALPSTVSAQEGPGALFTGMGFIDDHSVEDGTIVEAWIRGVPVAATEIFNQGFILHVAEPAGESFEGEVVRFKFRGLETDASAVWVEGTESWILLYAYTGLEGEGGKTTADPEPGEIIAILELQNRLQELERERLEMGAEFERQAGRDIRAMTNRWQLAIAELRAEVEREIEQVKRKVELELRQITLGPGREAVIRKLNAELDAFIKDKRARLELESRLKEGYRDKEILEMAQARGFDLISLNRLISQLEFELERRKEMLGIPLENLVEFPEEPIEPPIEKKKLPTPPETPTPKESGRNRGFFTNSILADPNGLNNGLDPTALEVIGILITLAATGVQLVKGN